MRVAGAAGGCHPTENNQTKKHTSKTGYTMIECIENDKKQTRESLGTGQYTAYNSIDLSPGSSLLDLFWGILLRRAGEFLFGLGKQKQRPGAQRTHIQ
jgi:hypothetical protein